MQGFKRKVAFFGILFMLCFILSEFLVHAANEDIGLLKGKNLSFMQIQKEPKNTVDVLFVGDSLAYSGFSPMQMWKDYGIASMVGAQSGQKMQDTYLTIKKAVENQKIKLVVLESNVLYRRQGNLEGMKSFISQKAEQWFPIIQYHDMWKTVLFGKRYDRQNYKGYLLRSTGYPYTMGTYMSASEGRKPVSKENRMWLYKIRKLCKENRAQFLLVSMPSPKNYSMEKHNALQSYAGKHKMAYLDLNLKTDEIKIDWQTDTRDGGDHLNVWGATKTSRFLGKYLAEHYELQDHRGEKRYASWGTLCKKYEQKIRQELQYRKEGAYAMIEE